MILRCAKRLLLLIAVLLLASGSDWRQFRGSSNTSVSSQEKLPTTFGEQSNISWSKSLPGRGPSSPIVVGDRVLLTSSSGTRRDRLHVLCFDSRSSELIWERQLWATGPTLCHPFGGVAANTPASDGEHIFAMFSSNDLACFDLEGRLRWLRGFSHEAPHLRNDVGMASSPLVVGRTLIVQCQTQGAAFVAGLDAATGKTRWRHEQPKESGWSSPTLLAGSTPGEEVALLQSRSALLACQPHTGEVLWRYEAPCQATASVTTSGDCIYLPADGIHALQYDSGTRKVRQLWVESRLRCSNASPVVHSGRVYVMKSPGILVCGDATDGHVLWQLRLKGPVWATPVLAGGRMYVANHDGLVQTVELGERGKLVGTSQLDPEMLASPAVAGDAIYFRSQSRLWKVSAAPPGS